MRDSEFSTQGGEFFEIGKEISGPPREGGGLPKEHTAPKEAPIPAERVETTEEPRPRKPRRRSWIARAMATAAAAVTVAAAAVGMVHEVGLNLGLHQGRIFFVEEELGMVPHASRDGRPLSTEELRAGLRYEVLEQKGGWQVIDRWNDERDIRWGEGEWLLVDAPMPGPDGRFEQPNGVTLRAEMEGHREETTFSVLNWEDVQGIRSKDTGKARPYGSMVRWQDYLELAPYMKVTMWMAVESQAGRDPQGPAAWEQWEQDVDQWIREGAELPREGQEYSTGQSKIHWEVTDTRSNDRYIGGVIVPLGGSGPVGTGEITGLGLSANTFYQVEDVLYFTAHVESPEGYLSRDRFPGDLTYGIEDQQGSGWQVNDRRREAGQDTAMWGNEWLQVVTPEPDADGRFSEPKRLTISADSSGIHEEMTFCSVNWEDVPELECRVENNRISAWPGTELHFEDYLRIPQGVHWKWEPNWDYETVGNDYQGPIRVPDYSSPDIQSYMDENGFLPIRWFVFDDANHKAYSGTFYLAGGGSGQVPQPEPGPAALSNSLGMPRETVLLGGERGPVVWHANRDGRPVPMTEYGKVEYQLSQWKGPSGARKLELYDDTQRELADDPGAWLWLRLPELQPLGQEQPWVTVTAKDDQGVSHEGTVRLAHWEEVDAKIRRRTGDRPLYVDENHMRVRWQDCLALDEGVEVTRFWSTEQWPASEAQARDWVENGFLINMGQDAAGWRKESSWVGFEAYDARTDTLYRGQIPVEEGGLGGPGYMIEMSYYGTHYWINRPSQTLYYKMRDNDGEVQRANWPADLRLDVITKDGDWTVRENYRETGSPTDTVLMAVTLPRLDADGHYSRDQHLKAEGTLGDVYGTGPEKFISEHHALRPESVREIVMPRSEIQVAYGQTVRWQDYLQKDISIDIDSWCWRDLNREGDPNDLKNGVVADLPGNPQYDGRGNVVRALYWEAHNWETGARYHGRLDFVYPAQP